MSPVESAETQTVLPADLATIIDALAEVRVAERNLDVAREQLGAAEIRLAELVAVRRRDKDTGFPPGRESSVDGDEGALQIVQPSPPSTSSTTDRDE